MVRRSKLDVRAPILAKATNDKENKGQPCTAVRPRYTSPEEAAQVRCLVIEIKKNTSPPERKKNTNSGTLASRPCSSLPISLVPLPCYARRPAKKMSAAEKRRRLSRTYLHGGGLKREDLVSGPLGVTVQVDEDVDTVGVDQPSHVPVLTITAGDESARRGRP